ncbi:hypothetical protein LEP1GSC108_0680 [Leptospira weilii str. UI 13098]|uniref:Uncharacterized protein n=1 Tax=Leptospira weilii str. UI 13098 TaxID=1088542 RepID=M6Q5W8_9LEPT|nr:hypothetical protein LEP1GSC108_0680 [Leptospira weilii str. UI 13098]
MGGFILLSSAFRLSSLSGLSIEFVSRSRLHQISFSVFVLDRRIGSIL